MPNEEVGKPRCDQTNRRGEPCKAWPIRGSTSCSVHNPNAPQSRQFAPGPDHTKSPGPPRKPTLGDIVRAQILENPDAALRPILDARDSAVIVLASVKDGVVVTDEPDHAVRLRAASEFIALGFAKAKSDAELTVEQGVDGGVVVRLAFDPKPEEAE